MKEMWFAQAEGGLTAGVGEEEVAGLRALKVNSPRSEVVHCH